MKTRILLMVMCGLIVAILATVTPANASITEQQLRSAQSRLGIGAGKYSVFIIGGAPNAEAYPNGKIVFTSGMMQLVADEDEAAAVLAHEKTHVDQRHGKRQQKETLSFGLLGYGLARAAGANGKQATVAGIGVAALRHQRFSLRDEYRADEGAVKALAEAGYRPDALSTLFARMGSQSTGANGSEALCFAGLPSHPSFAARQQAMRRQLEQAPQKPATVVGPILVAVENRVRGYNNGFYIYTTRRIYPAYDDPSSKIAPAMIGSLVNNGFDVVESSQVFDYLNGYNGRYDEQNLLEIAEKVRASHVLIVALMDDNTVSTGSVQINTGRFGQRGVELEAAQRKIRLTARLVQANRLVVWSSTRKGSEGTFVAGYRDFGFFNGTGAQVGHTDAGAAVGNAVKRIVEQLRKDVKPSEPPKPASAPSKDEEGLGVPEPEPAAPKPTPPAETADCWANLDRGYATPGEVWGVYHDADGMLVGKFKAIRVEGRKLLGKWIEGELPGQGKTCRPLNRAD